MSPERSYVDTLAILIDIDPFFLAKHLAKGSVLALSCASVCLDEADAPARLDVLVLTTARSEIDSVKLERSITANALQRSALRPVF